MLSDHPVIFKVILIVLVYHDSFEEPLAVVVIWNLFELQSSDVSEVLEKSSGLALTQLLQTSLLFNISNSIILLFLALRL